MCELASIKIHGGHRMSDSLVTKLKNKITYRVKTAVQDLVDDPEANAYAKEQAEKADKVEPLDTDIPTTAGDLKGDAAAKAAELKNAIPRDKFSMKRIFNQIWEYIKYIYDIAMYPLLVIILAMLVSNEMIMYAAPIRAIFFIFVIILCIKFSFPAGVLTTYYLGKAGYSYYINNLSDGPKQRIMPRVFAILPILMNKERPWYTRYLLYPFTYPKTEKKAGYLKEIMDTYLQSLKDSFPFAEKILKEGSVEGFQEKFDKVKEYLDTMHDLSEVVFPQETDETPANETPANETPEEEPSETNVKPEPVRKLFAPTPGYQKQGEVPSETNAKPELVSNPLFESEGSLQSAEDKPSTPSAAPSAVPSATLVRRATEINNGNSEPVPLSSVIPKKAEGSSTIEPVKKPSFTPPTGSLQTVNIPPSATTENLYEIASGSKSPTDILNPPLGKVPKIVGTNTGQTMIQKLAGVPPNQIKQYPVEKQQPQKKEKYKPTINDGLVRIKD